MSRLTHVPTYEEVKALSRDELERAVIESAVARSKLAARIEELESRSSKAEAEGVPPPSEAPEGTSPVPKATKKQR